MNSSSSANSLLVAQSVQVSAKYAPHQIQQQIVQDPISEESPPQLAQTSSEPADIPSEPSSHSENTSEHYSCPIPKVTTPSEELLIPLGNGKIQVGGSTVFDQGDLNMIVRDIIPQLETEVFTPEQLLDAANKIANEITKRYLAKNYITSQAQIEPSAIGNEPIEIRVTEGRLQEIQVNVEGSHRLDHDYICSRILRGVRIPFNTAQLEDQLKLLKVDPLFENVSASLRASEQQGQEGQKGQSILEIYVKEAPPFVVSLSADNYFPPSIGSERFGGELRYRNLTGIGDELAASYFRSSTGGADVYDFSYLVPLNSLNGTLLLRAAPNRTEITESSFDQVDIRGTQQVYQIIYRQPIIRSTIEEFALSLGFTYQDGLTLLNGQPFSFGTDTNNPGVSRTSVFSFSHDYLRRDSQGAWSLRSQFNLGTGLFDATANEGNIPDGQFFSWLGQARRVQRFGDTHLVLIQADLQLTPDALLPSQQFVIGGAQSVRGYRQNLRSGDNGFRVSIEDQIALVQDENGDPRIQLIPFLDLGLVWNQPSNPDNAGLPSQRTLIGTGLGLLINQPFDIDGLSIRLDYGLPLVDIVREGGSDNLQDHGFYFSVLYQPLGN